METMLASLIVGQQEMVKHFDGCLDYHISQYKHHCTELDALKRQRDKHVHNKQRLF